MGKKQITTKQLNSYLKKGFKYEQAFPDFKKKHPKTKFIRRSTYQGLLKELQNKPLGATQKLNVAMFKTPYKGSNKIFAFVFRDKLSYTGLNTYFYCNKSFARNHSQEFSDIRDIYIDWVVNNSGLEVEYRTEWGEKESVSEIDIEQIPEDIKQYPARWHQFEFSELGMPVDKYGHNKPLGYWQYSGKWWDGTWRPGLEASNDFPAEDISDALIAARMAYNIKVNGKYRYRVKKQKQFKQMTL